MRLLLFMLLVFLGACESNENPNCLKQIKEVQVLKTVYKNEQIAFAIGRVCKKRDTDTCTGQKVMIPWYIVSEADVGKKLTLFRNTCFFFDGSFDYVNENNEHEQLPVIDYLNSKKTVTTEQWDEFVEDLIKKEYQTCLSYAARDFKNASQAEFEKTCKCVINILFADDIEGPGSMDRFQTDLRAHIKNTCGKYVPDYMLQHIPE